MVTNTRTVLRGRQPSCLPCEFCGAAWLVACSRLASAKKERTASTPVLARLASWSNGREPNPTARQEQVGAAGSNAKTCSLPAVVPGMMDSTAHGIRFLGHRHLLSWIRNSVTAEVEGRGPYHTSGFTETTGNYLKIVIFEIISLARIYNRLIFRIYVLIVFLIFS
uniref:Uncharacterized protein n=1 Tax=Arundo donax TaxID=35708 RepID=A0A0A9C5U3_ARUDO